MPDGARRRVVLLSDGRENIGDARAEASSLKAQGLSVDSVAVEGGSGPDAAVLRVDAPSRVRVGERFSVEAALSSNTSMQATLMIRKGDRVIQRKTLTLEAGERQIRFE